MNRWQWENVWALWAVLAMFVLPWIVALATVPHLFATYQTVEVRHALLLVIAFGAGYGIAAICFGLGVEAIGIALNFAIALGTATAVGSAIPLFWFHAASVFTHQGYLIETGIAVIVIGIVLCGIAGRSKERDQARKLSEAKSPASSGFAKGLVLALVAGAGSALQGFVHVNDAGWDWEDYRQFFRLFYREEDRAQAAICLNEQSDFSFYYLRISSRAKDGKVLVVRSSHGRTLVFEHRHLWRRGDAHGRHGAGFGMAAFHVCNHSHI